MRYAARMRLPHAALYVVIAALAWTYSRQHPAHRLVSLLFGWELLANAARLAIGPTLDAAPTPYSGGVLVLYYLDHASVLSFRFAILAATVRHFSRASIWPVFYGFLACVAAFVVIKELSGTSLVPIHAAVAALTVAIAWAFVFRAILAPATRLQAPDGVHAALLLILALAFVKVCLHYFGPVNDTWADVRSADVLVHGLIAVAYIAAIVGVRVRRWRA